MFGLRPATNTRNPWFREYWHKLTGCSGHTGSRFCDQNASLRGNSAYEQDSKVQFVIDAVYAFANALQSLKNDLCPRARGMCQQMKMVDGGYFYKNYLLKTSFIDLAESIVKFDEKGDGPARYTIFNYQKNDQNNGYDYRIIGKWNDKLMMNVSDVIWGVDPAILVSNTLGSGRDVFLPKSRCSEPCGLGAVKKMSEGEKCCWVCTWCQDHEFVVDEFSCSDCGVGRWPHANKTSCFDIEVQYMWLGSSFSILPISIASLGIILTVITIIILVRNRDTPLVRASGRELSYVLLSGVLVCFFNTFLLLAKPTVMTCTLQRFGVGLGFSIVYGALLTKTNRIFRIFRMAAKSAARPNFVSPRSQLLITFSIAGVQLVATVVWCLVHLPDIQYDYPTRAEVILKCNINDAAFVISQVYSMVLITVCTFYAIKTRKVPENFNEAKYIGFTMYTTCIIWLAFVPLYFGTANSHEIQMTTLCVTISLSAYVTLVCLYSPKLYIIVLHPEKNVRKLTMNTVKKPQALPQPGLAQMSSANGSNNGPGTGYNMLSGKTRYYNAIKTDSIKAESCVTLANGSATPATVLVPRAEVKKCDNENIKVTSHENTKNEKCINNGAHDEETFKEKMSPPSIENCDIDRISASAKETSSPQISKMVEMNNIKNKNIFLRKGSLTSECSSSTEVDTPKHQNRISSLRKSFHLDECNSEISFLSETTRDSTPLNGSPNLRSNSLRLKKELRGSRLAEENSRGSHPELRETLSCKKEKAHIVTLGNSNFETVPFGLSQDIPDVFL